jgi:peptidoglycan L-alanyl-D-glutamate endopeptidase CwlK
MKIDTLELEFKAKVIELLAKAEEVTGYKWVITSARRTMAEQQALYDQGRTKPGRVVTKAAPGSSAHNFGLAADLAPLKDGKIWWEAPKTKWRAMADCARGIGLVSGYYFKTIFDAPHVESKNWREVRAQWKEGKVVVA